MPNFVLRENAVKAFAAVAASPEGREVLRIIYVLTGYGSDVKRFNQETSDLNPNATIYNLSKRDVWLPIRELLPPEVLLEIEHPEIRREDHGRGNDSNASDDSGASDGGDPRSSDTVIDWFGN